MKHCACYAYGVLCLLQRKPLHFPLPMYLIKNFYTICHFCACVCGSFGLYAGNGVWATLISGHHILLQTTRTGYKVQYVERL